MSIEDQDAPARREPERKRGGVWVTIGDEQFRIPPLSLLGLQELKDELVTARSIVGITLTPEQHLAVARVVHCALARNYPSISLEEVREMLDLGNFRQVFDATLGIAGFRKPEAGSAATGEALASTGASSTAH